MSAVHLAGGCFWGMEAALRRLPGITDTECGYANGRIDLDPTYEDVCRGDTGYVEAVKVDYDPDTIQLEDILSVFFFLIDPTRDDGQGNDVGTQYRTAVFWSDTDSARRIWAYFIGERKNHKRFFTRAEPLYSYHRAEEYHQGYLERNPEGYCHIPRYKMDILSNLLSSNRDA